MPSALTCSSAAKIVRYTLTIEEFTNDRNDIIGYGTNDSAIQTA